MIKLINGNLFCFGLSLVLTAIWSLSSTAAEETPRPVGKEAAREILRKRSEATPEGSGSQAKETNRQPASGSSSEHYLAIHLGTYFGEDVYNWGKGPYDDIGQLNTGVTYRMGEWVNSLDLLFRADFSSYHLREGRALKLSLLPMLAFPDASSRFPLYFGAGAGAGVFLKQISNESAISFDYQLVMGARFFDLFESMGVLLELGLKNHILLLSDGQYNGVFGAIGMVFTF